MSVDKYLENILVPILPHNLVSEQLIEYWQTYMTSEGLTDGMLIEEIQEMLTELESVIPVDNIIENWYNIGELTEQERISLLHLHSLFFCSTILED